MTAHLPAPDLTVRETAAELNCTEKNVRNLIDRGHLAAIRYGTRFVRIPRAALDEFRAAHSTITPAQHRAELLGEETVQAVAETAAEAPPLSEEQRDTVRAAFRAPPKIRRHAPPHPKGGRRT
jgi:excisionase family DNA binding protein